MLSQKYLDLSSNESVNTTENLWLSERENESNLGRVNRISTGLSRSISVISLVIEGTNRTRGHQRSFAKPPLPPKKGGKPLISAQNPAAKMDLDWHD